MWKLFNAAFDGFLMEVRIQWIILKIALESHTYEQMKYYVFQSKIALHIFNTEQHLFSLVSIKYAFVKTLLSELWWDAQSSFAQLWHLYFNAYWKGLKHLHNFLNGAVYLDLCINGSLEEVVEYFSSLPATLMHCSPNLSVANQMYLRWISSLFLNFFFVRRIHVCPILGPLVPLFGFLVMCPLGFKARVGSALFALQRWM